MLLITRSPSRTRIYSKTVTLKSSYGSLKVVGNGDWQLTLCDPHLSALEVRFHDDALYKSMFTFTTRQIIRFAISRDLTLNNIVTLKADLEVTQDH